LLEDDPVISVNIRAVCNPEDWAKEASGSQYRIGAVAFGASVYKKIIGNLANDIFDAGNVVFR
jgi:hypothetical protein